MTGVFAAWKTIATNVWRTLSQDTLMLKLNTALLVSFGQITSRSWIAQRNADKAQENGSPIEAAYAKREASKTIFREWGGFTSNFGVLKVVETALKAAGSKLFNVEVTRDGATSLTQGLGQAVQAVFSEEARNKLHKVKVLPGTTTFKPLNDEVQQIRFKPLLRWLGERFTSVEQRANLSEKELLIAGFKGLHQWGPLLTGAIAGCYLSGWLLERTSLLHGQQIVDYLSGVHHDDLKAAHLKAQQAGTLPSGVQPLDMSAHPAEHQALFQAQPANTWVSPAPKTARPLQSQPFKLQVGQAPAQKLQPLPQAALWQSAFR